MVEIAAFLFILIVVCSFFAELDANKQRNNFLYPNKQYKKEKNPHLFSEIIMILSLLTIIGLFFVIPCWIIFCVFPLWIIIACVYRGYIDECDAELTRSDK